MSCPTCDKTLHRLFNDNGRVHFHCPCCGTHVSIVLATGHTDVTRPALVERCREFEQTLGMLSNPAMPNRWRELGIAEAINIPDDRPK